MTTEWQQYLDDFPKRTELVFRLNQSLRCGFVYDAHRRGKEAEWQIDGYSMLYIMRGSGRYSDDYGSSDFAAGSVVQRFPGRRHRVRFNRGHQMFQLCMRIPAGAFELFSSSNTIRLDQPVFEIGLRPELPQRMEQLLAELRAQAEQDLHQSMAHIFQFMSDIHRLRAPADAGDERLPHACRLLREKVDERIPIESIAEALGMNYDSFRKFFRKHMQMAPGDYRIRCRLEQIQELLVNQDTSISQIAQDFGYPDLYSFSRQFKKFTGVSPRQFRNLQRA